MSVPNSDQAFDLFSAYWAAVHVRAVPCRRAAQTSLLLAVLVAACRAEDAVAAGDRHMRPLVIQADHTQPLRFILRRLE